MQRVATEGILADVLNRQPSDVAPCEPSGHTRRRVLTASTPMPLQAEVGGAAVFVIGALPVPALHWVADVHEGPELKKSLAELWMNPWQAQLYSSLSESPDAADASVAVVVAGNLTVQGSMGVIQEWTQWTLDDPAVEIVRNFPAWHGVAVGRQRAWRET